MKKEMSIFARQINLQVFIIERSLPSLDKDIQGSYEYIAVPHKSSELFILTQKKEDALAFIHKKEAERIMESLQNELPFYSTRYNYKWKVIKYMKEI